jgi:hypothetical protein
LLARQALPFFLFCWVDVHSNFHRKKGFGAFIRTAPFSSHLLLCPRLPLSESDRLDSPKKVRTPLTAVGLAILQLQYCSKKKYAFVSFPLLVS